MQNVPWKVDVSASSEEILHLCGIWRCIVLFMDSRHWTILLSQWMHSYIKTIETSQNLTFFIEWIVFIFFSSILITYFMYIVNPRYNGLFFLGGGSVISDVRYNRVKGYSRKYTIGYITNTRRKRRNTQCDYMKVFIFGLFFTLNNFLAIKPSQCLNIPKNSQLYTARLCPL
jgi:hypothetical protein